MSSCLRAIAEETIRIVDRGGYQVPGGGEVRIADQIGLAIAGTRLYLPEDQVSEPKAQPSAVCPGVEQPAVEVTRETTLAAARRLGQGVAALVFASAKNPGGGFRNGAQAQEESVARASALHACQATAGEFYVFHRQQRDLRYSDRVIYSPDVPVFRADDGSLLPEPYAVSFLTAAAPNLGAIIASQQDTASGVPGVLRGRAARVLQVAAAHRHRRLVLGAWGCGVFGNDPTAVAAAFADILPAARWFDQIVFATHDPRPASLAYAAFADVFG